MHVSLQACASAALGVLVAVVPLVAHPAEFIPNPNFVPKADTYICPNSTGGAVDCYLDAVPHLYTMCRHVKSIEIIEFGYEKSAEGTNSAKTEYCLDKQKQNIERPYRAALKDALRSKHVVEALRALHEIWLSALTGLAWRSGESDADYKTRVARPYDDFRERIAGIRVVAASKPEPAAKPASRKKASAKANP